ncbi:MAG: hypothetical protein LBL19_01990 [Spirochaetaceae bacterium]|nr:hypothetical protein [Spirochaetaceae bacterium]
MGLLVLLPGGIFSQETGSGGAGIEASRRGELVRLLGEGGIPFEVRPLFTEYGGFGSSLLVRVSPESAAEGAGRFILALPLSSAEDPGALFPYGLQAGLAFIQKAREGGIKKEILVAFLGDEQSRFPPELRKSSPAGLEDLLALQENPENTVLVYADLYAPPEKLRIHHGGNRSLTPLNVLEVLPGLCDARGIPFGFAVKANELYKLGFVDGPPALRTALEYGIPSWYLEGARNGPEAPAANPIPADVLGELLLEYAASLNFSAENLDYHYLIFQNFGKTVFIPELTTVFILWAFSALGFLMFLIYSIIWRKMLIIQWTLFFRWFWVIGILFTVLFLTLQGSELFFGFLLERFSLSREKIYYGGILFTLGNALILFSLLSPLVERLKIPRKASFYGNAAVILIILGSLIALVLDITFIPAFLWAFLFTVLAALLPFPLPVYGITFIIPLQIAQTVITSMGAVTTGLPVFTHSNRLALILFVAVTSFPSVLIFQRASALSGERRKRSPRLFRLVSRFILLAAGIGALTVYMRNQTPQAEPVRRVIAERQDRPEILDVTVTGSTFLSRRILEITLSARAAPARFDLYLDSESGRPSLYTAPMPFVVKENPPQGSTLEFILGENPPNPFTATMVLPLNFSGTLRVEALYTRYDPALDTAPPPEGNDYLLRVTQTLPL